MIALCSIAALVFAVVGLLSLISGEVGHAIFWWVLAAAIGPGGWWLLG